MNEYAYEWAAMSILVTLELIYLGYKRIKVRRTAFFMAFIQISIVSDILTIGYTHLVRNTVGILPEIIEWYIVFNNLFLVLRLPFFAYYMYEVVAKDEWKFVKTKTALLYFPVFLQFWLLVINNLGSHFMYTFKDGVLYTTRYNKINDWVYLCYLLIILVIYLTKRNHFTLQHKKVMLLFLIMEGTVFCFYLFEGGMVLSGISTGISAMGAFIFQENPESYTDRETGFFNKYGFLMYCRNQFLHKNEFHSVVISLKNYRAISLIQTESNHKLMDQQVKTYIESLAEKVKIFRITASVYVLVAEKDVVAAGIYEKVKQTIAKDNEDEIIVKLDGYVYLIPDNLQYGSSEYLLNRIVQVSEYTDPNGKKHYFRIYDIYDELLRESQVEDAVRRAIEEEGFEMYFQPVYDVKKETFNKAEALIRLKDEKLGFIPPDEFITLAEQKGLIRKITKQVIRKTLSAINEYGLQELGVDSININLSTRDIWEGDLKQYLPKVMEQEQIPASMVTLEITETVASGNKEIASDFMNKMVSLGYRFAVDDYGTGYSNIERTISLPFDSIKIDKSLFYLAVETEKMRYLVDHTITIFHDLGFQVVVEGAETQEHIKVLQSMDIDYIQGYFYSKPLPGKQYVAFLKEHNHLTD